MSVTFSPEKKIPAEDKVVLNVLLKCEQTKSTETKQIRFQSLPTTPLEIKKKIEEDFSIPSCVQTLHYQSMILKDSDQLQHTHFRSGDTFTVDYSAKAECEVTRDVIKWLKELYELLQSIESFSDEVSNPSISSKIESMILEGSDIIKALGYTLFIPWDDKMKLMNKYYFQQEGGLEMLMRCYGVLVSKEWGDLGIDAGLHIYLEGECSHSLFIYQQTYPLCRQIVQLGGLEMCTTAMLRRKMRGNVSILAPHIYNTLENSFFALRNLADLPECHMPLAMRTDIIDQALAIAMQPTYSCYTAKVSAAMIQCLTQSPETHTYIFRKDVVENMLQICEQRHEMINKQSSQSPQGKKEDTMMVNALKCNTSMALAQVGLGSPHLLFDSIPPQLLNQILNLMSDVLEAASPTEIRQYDTTEWNSFLPFLRYLYKPSSMESFTAENSVSYREETRTKLHISCCNVILYFLENTLGKELHLEFLLKEGLLDYTMCLPALLPEECQPRARSLVNELGKHRQLQPPSLCTLAKAHIAKTFCGLQPVMEMNSIGEFLLKYFPTS